MKQQIRVLPRQPRHLPGTAADAPAPRTGANSLSDSDAKVAAVIPSQGLLRALTAYQSMPAPPSLRACFGRAPDLGVGSQITGLPVAHAASSSPRLSWQLEKAHAGAACVLLRSSISCVDVGKQAACGLHPKQRRPQSAWSKLLPQSKIRFHTMTATPDTVRKV